MTFESFLTRKRQLKRGGRVGGMRWSKGNGWIVGLSWVNWCSEAARSEVGEQATEFGEVWLLLHLNH